MGRMCTLHWIILEFDRGRIVADLAGCSSCFLKEKVFLSGNDIWDTCPQKIISKKMKHIPPQPLVYQSNWYFLLPGEEIHVITMPRSPEESG